MADELYSVDRVAEMLGLHVKTVRNYVRGGRLKATRIGKQYRITSRDLDAFTGAATAERDEPPERHAQVSGVVRLDGVGPDDAHRIVASVTGAAGARSLLVQTSFEEARSALTIVVVGDLDRTAELLKIISPLARRP
ncbi:helix-turn-helix domain-containing protein [Actinomadura rupiterrae]|uniref:helix-turn-helix domain-containing protein n=1 Tax=Actinomadura rupiterrae TaxID=559627 RepID=UPI0020A51204|nr:helix-turn-helix domain-containing protein [Actinomadura rupiterrae]MCP2335879.1 excisionase family DNA binding protein [Actinomadura rupiterrae]